MRCNSNLRKAAKAKQDEFYTQLSDVEKELRHYKQHFKDKIVYCNCDDPVGSSFFKYFHNNFKQLGIKKLMTTCYKNENSSKKAYYLEYLGPTGAQDLITDLNYYYLEGDGDFRSDECTNLLKQADIVVTNPPFSLFREFVAQLIKYDKKFLIIGSLNAITYNDIFNHIKNNKMWLGYSNGSMSFRVPDTYTGACSGVAGQKEAKLGNICWYTNLDISKHSENIILCKKYTEEEYPKYDNYDAINVNKVKDIPEDYYGAMGVPITFLDKYNPKQFDILGSFHAGANAEDLGATKTEIITSGKTIMWNGPVVNKTPLYVRIIIQKV